MPPWPSPPVGAGAAVQNPQAQTGGTVPRRVPRGLEAVVVLGAAVHQMWPPPPPNPPSQQLAPPVESGDAAVTPAVGLAAATAGAAVGLGERKPLSVPGVAEAGEILGLC